LSSEIDPIMVNTCTVIYRKNDFAKVSKNLVRTGTDLKIILLNYQNYYVGHLIL